MIPSKYEWPSTDVVLVVNMVSGTIDTINIDYDYIAINNFFKASDGTIYAATDRGVFKLDITTDVEPINGNDNLINIYPNPASDLINICYQNSENIKSIKIINQLGEIVYDNDVIASGNYIQISTKEFASGIYYCLMKMEDRTVSQKFVIVR